MNESFDSLTAAGAAGRARTGAAGIGARRWVGAGARRCAGCFVGDLDMEWRFSGGDDGGEAGGDEAGGDGGGDGGGSGNVEERGECNMLIDSPSALAFVMAASR
mmetsp:Transcript_1257/g.4011  ORF Transcript_1257/g.4011 Transcript_1257/m.4011 type:complete len:104 (+) Transcript_1257:3147-3458(+)|eukprot:scaffold20364_cov112-Isochrysis_galbana.AAC.6